MARLARKKAGSFELQVQDLLLRISAPEEYSEECRAAALSAWEQLQAYSLQHPDFRSSKTPVEVTEGAPAIVKEMAATSKAAGVGPAYTTTGAVCEHVGRFLAGMIGEVMVSTGGDYFIRSKKKMKLALYQGPSAGGLSVVVDPKRGTQGVFTSVGRIRVTVRDPAGHTASDVSDASFLLAGGAPSITVTTPNMAVTWAEGTTQQISWLHNLGAVALVRFTRPSSA